MKCSFRRISYIKTSKNDNTGPVHISIILNVYLAYKLLYVRPSDSKLYSLKKLIMF